MDTVEPIVIKSVTNNDYFGEPGVIRSIVEAFVPHVIGQPDRDVLFVHHKSMDAPVSISVEIHAATTQQVQVLAQHTLARLMGLPALTFEVRFTQIVDTAPAEFEVMTAPLEAENRLSRFIAGVNAKLDSEQRSKDAERIAYEESMWDRLMGLPMPWEIADDPERLAESQFVVDTLMNIVRDKWL